jgi:tetratricopeptide (TPR) repeat protein
MRINVVKHGFSFLILVFFIFLALGSGTAEKSVKEETAVKEEETAQTHYDRAQKYFDEKNWSFAIQEYTKAINLNPNFELAYANRGAAYSNDKAFTRAFEDLNKAIEINPGHSGIYRLRGQVHAKMGEGAVNSPREAFLGGDIDEYIEAISEFDLALADFNRAIELNPRQQEEIEKLIVEVQQKKEQAEAGKAKLAAQEEANRYDPAKFIIIVPANFRPADYTKMDLFDAIASVKDISSDIRWYGPLFGQNFVSDVVFVNQNGMNITFKTPDNAISQRMSIGKRSGLNAGQKVRIYYEFARPDPITTVWEVVAIERL